MNQIAAPERFVLNPQRITDATFKRLGRLKTVIPPSTSHLGPEMISFFKQSVQKRQTKLTQIAECWSQLVPPSLNDHCCLEAFSRGSLTVLVDTASHLYELKQLLLAGLQQQLLITCKASGLKKIVLRPGRWYEGDDDSRKPRFDR